MTITEKQVVDCLTSGGISIERWSVTEEDIPVYINDRGELIAQIVEDDDLALATASFLRCRGQE